jgi:DNA ligase-associated metallophosphoesterase
MREAKIVVAGEALTLLAERALFWPRQSTLFIADPHFGKDATFRSAGIGLPQGSLDADLTRLDEALRHSGAGRLLVLGDFFHAKEGRTPDTLHTLATWRQAHHALEIVLVRGNHDRHAGEPPTDWRITNVGDFLGLPPFVCCHMPYDPAKCDPWPADEASYRLAGHVHPVIQLRDTTGGELRFTCFTFGKEQGLLPAFGAFTGGYAIRPQPGDRVFVLTPEGVHQVR